MRIRLLVFLLLISAANLSAQQGIYRNSIDFINGDLHLVGELVEVGENHITFKIEYSELSYKSWEIWGYQDSEGRNYRSIDKLFFRIENEGPIWMYSRESKDGSIRLISYGIGGEVVELNLKNVMEAIESNTALLEQYKSLKKADRIHMMEDVLESFNRSYPKTDLSLKE